MDRFSVIFASLQVAGFVVVALRLIQLGIGSRFRYFTLFCVFEPLRILASLAIPHNTTTYGYFFFITQPFVWTLYVLITLEVFRNAFGDHQAIYSVSRKAMTWCVAAAVLLAAATAGIDLAQDQVRYPVLEFFMIAERTVTLSLLVFIVALMSLLSWFPVPLNRNVLLHTVIFTFFFGAKTALLFSRNLFGPDFTRAGNIGLLCTCLACLATWAALLVSAGRASLVRSGVSRSPETQARLLAQLEAINNTLAGTLRK